MSHASQSTDDSDTDVDEEEPWDRLADLDDLLEQIVTDEMPLDEEAETLLDELEERGYR